MLPYVRMITVCQIGAKVDQVKWPAFQMFQARQIIQQRFHYYYWRSRKNELPTQSPEWMLSIYISTKLQINQNVPFFRLNLQFSSYHTAVIMLWLGWGTKKTLSLALNTSIGCYNHSWKLHQGLLKIVQWCQAYKCWDIFWTTVSGWQLQPHSYTTLNDSLVRNMKCEHDMIHFAET